LIFFLVSSVEAANIPTLVDIVVMGEKEKPYFDQASLQLDLEKEYLFRIVNEKPFGITLYHDNFGQKVATYYLQGVPTASHESLDLPPNSTVLWHFMPLEQGEFYFLALTAYSNKKEEEKKLQIRVGKEEEKQASLSSSEKLKVEKKKMSFFQRRSSR